MLNILLYVIYVEYFKLILEFLVLYSLINLRNDIIGISLLF